MKRENTVSKRLSSAFLCGLIFSVIVVCAWFLSSDSFRSVSIAILLTASAIFILSAAVNFPVRNKSKAAKIIANVLMILLSVISCFSATVYTLSPKLLFYPNFDEASYNELQNYENAEEISFETENGTVSGWFLHNAEGTAPLVLYFGGNGENSSSRTLDLLNSEKLWIYDGYNFAFLDYPGYGKSEGAPSEESLKQYGLAAYDYLLGRDDVERIVIHSYSIGTGISNYVASEIEPSGMILMAPYADGYDLYNNVINVFYGPLRLLISYKMEAVKFAEMVQTVPLILATESDGVVPYQSSLRLSKAYPNGCAFITTDNTEHNGFWDNEQSLSCIAEYLKGVKGNG